MQNKKQYYANEYKVLLENLAERNGRTTISHMFDGLGDITSLFYQVVNEVSDETALSEQPDSDLLALMQSINEILADRYYHDDVFDELENAIIESRKTIEAYNHVDDSQ